jgi:hypothetical protein
MKKLLLVLLVLLGLQTQAQMSPCDSVGYTIISGSGGNPTLQLNGVINGVCPINFPCAVVSWEWYVYNPGLCFSDTGQTVAFYQLNINDTIEVCLSTVLDINNSWYMCSQCGHYVYGLNGWMKLGVLTSIKEIEANIIKNNKMYDLLGREIFETPKGTMYIQNRKKYIR